MYVIIYKWFTNVPFIVIFRLLCSSIKPGFEAGDSSRTENLLWVYLALFLEDSID